MAIEYLLVTFPQQCAVLADGVGVGLTNHILTLPGDEYEISLEGDSCAPASQVIALAGTSLVKPMVICFDLVTTAAAMVRSASPALATDTVPAKPRATRGPRAPAKAVAKVRKTASAPRKAQLAKPALVKAAARVKKDA